jgi:hypothetical protein
VAGWRGDGLPGRPLGSDPHGTTPTIGSTPGTGTTRDRPGWGAEIERIERDLRRVTAAVDPVGLVATLYAEAAAEIARIAE